MDLTLLEIRIPEFPLLPSDREADRDGVESGDDAEEGRGVRPLVAIGVVVGLALLARWLGRSEDCGSPPDDR